MRALAAPLVAIAMSVAAPAAGQNFLANPGFDRDLASWTGDTGLATWSSTDAGGTATSGSVRLRNPVSFPGGTEGIRQCVAVEGGRTYRFGARFLTPTGGAPGRAGVAVGWYALSGCPVEQAILNTPPTTRTETGAWIAIEAIATAPASARYAFYNAYNEKSIASGTRDVFVDDAVLAEPVLATRTFPASASVQGANNSFFQTDLWLVNRSHLSSIPVTVRLHCLRGLTCAGSTAAVTLAPRASLLTTDAVGTLLASPGGAGALTVSWEAGLGELAAAARVYTPSQPAPTSGTAVPALEASQARTLALLPALAHSGGDLTTGFRTNLGLFNPSSSGNAAVTLELRDGSGSLLGSVSRTVAPGEAVQVNDVFAEAGAGSLVTRNAYAVMRASLPVFAYATSIDNRSGDSVFIAAGDDDSAP